MSRIRFFRVRKPKPLRVFLQTHLQLEDHQADFLINIGAIYCNFQRTIENINLQAGDILRCHTQPKRFLSETQWSEQIVMEHEDFVMVDKPPGLPCQPSLDNRLENVLFQLNQQYKQPLFITHRLDVGTRGLMVLAKNKTFQTHFNQLLEDRQVTKIYEALTVGPTLPCGLLTHWMRPQARAPKILSRDAVDKWKNCILEILSGQLLAPLPASVVLQTSAQTNRGINHYRLQLQTGRTHQIRAQLSFEQNPLLGDVLYGGPSHQLPFEWHALQCSALTFSYQEKTFHRDLPALRLPSSILANSIDGSFKL